MTREAGDIFRARTDGLSRTQRENLARSLGVTEASDQPAQLVAYLVVEGKAPATEDLRGLLADRLPDYMIPARYVVLDALPRTPSGKIDRAALGRLGLEPQPLSSPDAVPVESHLARPSTDAEKTLAGIWMAALGTDEIDIHDDFFELGGDSILSIRVIARANEAGLGITPQQFFASPTVADLAALVETESDA